MKNIKSNEVAVLVIGPFNEPFDYSIESEKNSVCIGQVVFCLLYTSDAADE